MCLKGLSVFGFSIFFFFYLCASFGKELFHFKGGEEEEEDSIIEYPKHRQKRETTLTTKEAIE